MTIAKDWFVRHWRGAATVALGLFGPLAVARQSLCAAARLQRHLHRLRPDAEVEAPADVPRRAHAVPRRRGVPRLRVPQEQPHLRTGLFRRPRRLGDLRPRLPGGDVRLRPRQPHRRSARCCGSPPASPGRSAPAGAARSFPTPWPARSPSAATLSLAPAFGPQDAGDQRLQGRLLRAEIPGFEEGLRERVAFRLSRGLFQLLPSFRARASPTTPGSASRPCRRTRISACTSTATARSASCAT